MSSISAGSRSGATFRNTGGPAPRASITAASSSASAPLSCSAAQARRVGRGDVDGEIVGDAGHRRDAGGIIGDRGPALSLLAPILTPTMPPARAGALRRAAPQRRRLALIVEAHAVDHRPVLGQPEQPRLRIARLRPRRQRADLDEAEAEARASARKTSASLSKPAASPTGLGKASPATSIASIGSAAAAARPAAASAPGSSADAPARRRARRPAAGREGRAPSRAAMAVVPAAWSKAALDFASASAQLPIGTESSDMRNRNELLRFGIVGNPCA